MKNNYVQIIDCLGKGKQHQWTYEVVEGSFSGWGKGFMKQRRCLSCNTIQYLQFNDNIVHRNIELSKKDFEKILKELDKPSEPNSKLKEVFKRYGEE